MKSTIGPSKVTQVPLIPVPLPYSRGSVTSATGRFRYQRRVALGYFRSSRRRKRTPGSVKTGEQPDRSKHIKNIQGGLGHGGPCPPAGYRDHHYVLGVFALSAKLSLPDTTSRAHLKGWARGLYFGLILRPASRRAGWYSCRW